MPNVGHLALLAMVATYRAVAGDLANKMVSILDDLSAYWWSYFKNTF
jgi:hypothetical protein